ncbi:hypothetical protein BDB00DRAFT_910878 [Zychaea mexicana]|uniref:uncharacterized protein n=1 Tax=Zychaea mexicana TaxID=64656 RepID=UPI0022FE8AFC|nr:uncharacterized protein BDB00DRAFT_910878 [Zychaea mexicana]KAI9498362.1 hypothetical protein BDB00DRAFT_910878 [Zychaea mexicana]
MIIQSIRQLTTEAALFDTGNVDRREAPNKASALLQAPNKFRYRITYDDTNPPYVAAPSLMAPHGFWGFVENVFDKHLCYQAGNNQRVRITHYLTDYINQIYDGCTLFASALGFVLALLRSSQATVATAPERAAITPSNDHAVYQQDQLSCRNIGFSLDTDTYKFSPDFLMSPYFYFTLAHLTISPVQLCTPVNDGGGDGKETDQGAGLSIYHPPSDLVGTPGNPSPEPVQ